MEVFIMKRANGTGSVIKLKDTARRNPWYARITTGYTEKGYPKYKILEDENGNKYFKDRTMPDLLLAEYNRNKFNLNINKTDATFKEIYIAWSKLVFPTSEEIAHEKKTHEKARGKLSYSNKNAMRAAFNKCEKLWDRRYGSLRKLDFENMINNLKNCSESQLWNMLALFRKLDDYALDQDIIFKGYASLVKVDTSGCKERRKAAPFTYQEVNKIWEYEGTLIADILLVLLHSGMRIEELLFAKKKDAHIDEGYIIAGLKTESGKNRIVPIHDAIKSILIRRMNEHPESEFLISNSNGEKIDYNMYHDLFTKFMEELEISYHTTHDTRKSVRSELDRLGANKVCTDRILGHKNNDVGEDVYTIKFIEELIQTINLLDYRKKKNQKVTYLVASN